MVLVTGASGLLGRAVATAFAAAGWRVVGQAHARAQGGLVHADLRSAEACGALVAAAAPACVVHVAAERRPDVCERDPAATEPLNVEAVWNLGRGAAHAGSAFIYISTDYLWRGDRAPYAEDAPTQPPNSYGAQKRRGEHAALAAHAGAVVLRVPVLYGPTRDLAESAVTAFAATVLAGVPATIDDWQVRVPTFTPDVAATCVRIAEASPAPAGILHYSSKDRLTRWGLVQAFARMLRAPAEHVTRLEGPPPGAPRPYDCQLDCARIEALGLAAPCTPFEEGARMVLRGAGVMGEE